MEIHRPVGEVFAFLSHVENWTRLQPALRESEGGTSRGPMKVGDTFRQVLDISGQRIELLCKVIEVEQNERISLQYSWDQLSLDVGFVFEPLDDSTRLNARGEGRMSGFLALFEPLVNDEIDAQLKARLDDLKSYLESRATSKQAYDYENPD